MKQLISLLFFLFPVFGHAGIFEDAKKAVEDQDEVALESIVVNPAFDGNMAAKLIERALELNSSRNVSLLMNKNNNMKVEMNFQGQRYPATLVLIFMQKTEHLKAIFAHDRWSGFGWRFDKNRDLPFIGKVTAGTSLAWVALRLKYYAGYDIIRTKAPDAQGCQEEGEYTACYSELSMLAQQQQWPRAERLLMTDKYRDYFYVSCWERSGQGQTRCVSGLYYAIIYGAENIANLIIEKSTNDRININIGNELLYKEYRDYRQKPLYLALEKGLQNFALNFVHVTDGDRNPDLNIIHALKAAEKGYLEVLKAMETKIKLDTEVRVGECESYSDIKCKYNVLYAAASYGKKEVVKYLLDLPFKLDAEYLYKQSMAATYAVKSLDLETYKVLAEYGKTASNSYVWLDQSAISCQGYFSCRVPVVTYLIDQKKYDFLEVLLQGQELYSGDAIFYSEKDKVAKTESTYARLFREENFKALSLLLKYKYPFSDTNLIYYFLESPYPVFAEILRLIPPSKEQLTATGSGGLNLLHSLYSQPKTVPDNALKLQYFLQAGVFVDSLTAAGSTPLMYASGLAKRPDLASVKVLLNYGAATHIRNRANKTAASIAKENNQSEIYNLLCQAGPAQCVQ